ncbi:MAG: substrate-binding periplasmic protein [Desulfococcaceae bacterium]
MSEEKETKRRYTQVFQIVSLIILMGLLIPVCGICAETLRVSYFVLKPHTMPEEEEKRGVAIAYFRRIADKMGIQEISFTQLPLKRLMLQLENNESDLALFMGKNPERDAKFVFPGLPLISTKPVIAVKSSHPLKNVESAEDLLSLKIAHVADGYLSPMMRDSRLKFEPIHGQDTLSRGIEMVMKGYVDAYYIPDSYSMRFVVMSGGNASEIRIIALPESPMGLYSAFSKISAEKYMERYEKALVEVQREISYEDFFDQTIKEY